MASDVSELRVFLASPGDLIDERRALRALEASLNMVFARGDLRLRVTGWEDLPPGYGRPQGLINPMVDECDIFIGMLRRKWGTDTGEHETGFIEEFERAVARRRATGDEPEISLYFAQMSKDELDDAGPDLTQVLDFRRRVETERIALYSTFDGPEDLARKVETLLQRHLVSRVVERAKPKAPEGTSSSSWTASDSPAKQIEDIAPEEGERLGEAGVQITATLDSLRDLVRGREPQVPLDRDRLELLGIALGRDDETLGTHLVNRLYQRRRELDLIVTEHSAWVSTMLADIGRSDAMVHRVIPGWAVLDRQDPEVPQMLADFARTEDSVGRGALRSLMRLRIRPKSLWPPALRPDTDNDDSELTAVGRAENWVRLLNAHPGRSDAIDYLLQDLDSEVEATIAATGELIGEVAGTEGLNDRSRKMLKAAIEALEGSPDALGDALGYSDVDNAQWRLVLRHTDSLSAKLVNELARQTTNRHAKIAAIKAGLTAKSLSDENLAQLLLLDDDAEIADLLIASVAEDAGGTLRYIELMRDKSKFPTASTEARLLAQPASREQLDQMHATSDFSVLPWEALTYAAPEAFLDEAREALQTNADGLRARLQPKIGEEHKRLIDHLAQEQLRAAADLLSRQERPTEGDIDLILGWLDTEASTGLLRSYVWRVLVRVANASTSAKIEAALRPHVEVLGFRQAIEHLETPLAPAIAAVLSESDDDVLGEETRRWHIRQPERTDEELSEALYADEPAVRMAAAEALTGRLTRDELVELQDQYSGLKDRYWYNVIAMFDEHLYAPTPCE